MSRSGLSITGFSSLPSSYGAWMEVDLELRREGRELLPAQPRTAVLLIAINKTLRTESQAVFRKLKTTLTSRLSPTSWGSHQRGKLPLDALEGCGHHRQDRVTRQGPEAIVGSLCCWHQIVILDALGGWGQKRQKDETRGWWWRRRNGQCFGTRGEGTGVCVDVGSGMDGKGRTGGYTSNQRGGV